MQYMECIGRAEKTAFLVRGHTLEVVIKFKDMDRVM